MNFSDLLKIEDVSSTEIRLVRHGYKEIDPLTVFREDHVNFNAYQAFQLTGKFGNARHIAVFAPYHGTQALFLGVWEIEDEMPALNAPKGMLKKIE